MKRRTVRITPLGYIVLIIIILVMVVSIYFIVWSMRNAGSEQGAGQPQQQLCPDDHAYAVPRARRRRDRRAVRDHRTDNDRARGFSTD